MVGSRARASHQKAKGNKRQELNFAEKRIDIVYSFLIIGENRDKEIKKQ